MPKPRPIKAWAIVNKKKPKLYCQLIFEDTDIMLDDSEKLVRVIIKIDDTSTKHTRRTK